MLRHELEFRPALEGLWNTAGGVGVYRRGEGQWGGRKGGAP